MTSLIIETFLPNAGMLRIRPPLPFSLVLALIYVPVTVFKIEQIWDLV
jgi:hypothetical protein